jgi:hypothetical protein
MIGRGFRRLAESFAADQPNNFSTRSCRYWRILTAFNGFAKLVASHS